MTRHVIDSRTLSPVFLDDGPDPAPYADCTWEPYCLVHGDYCERTGADCVKPRSEHPLCDGEARLHADLPRTCTVTIGTECPTCAGSGDVATTQDYFGTWDTETCRTCRGTGEVTTAEAESIRERTCVHGHVEDEDGEHECTLCMYARHADVDGPNPWKTGALHVVGGWDAEPPF